MHALEAGYEGDVGGQSKQAKLRQKKVMKAQKKLEHSITLIEQGEFDNALQILKSTLLEG